MPAFPTISVGPVVRDPDEEHRASTPLELFVDLCFVVAVAQSAGALHHELVIGEVAYGVVGFLMAFFGAWWAWMNFTWFASAHDADDVPYRLLTLVQITGVLIYAAAVPRMVEDHDLTLSVIGYVIMRLALVTQWLRVARHFPEPARPLPALRRRDHAPPAAVAGDPRRPGARTRRGCSPCWRSASCRSRSGPRGPPAAAGTGGCSTPSTSRSATGCSRSSCSASRAVGDRRHPGGRLPRRVRRPHHRRGRRAADRLRRVVDLLRPPRPPHAEPAAGDAVGATSTSSCSSRSPPSAPGSTSPPRRWPARPRERTGALAVAIPVAGYLVGIVAVDGRHPPRAAADLRSCRSWSARS